MKNPSLTFSACVTAALLLTLAGCTTPSRPAQTISQKSGANQTTPYAPYYQSGEPVLNPAPQRNAGQGTAPVLSPPMAPTLPAQGKARVAILLPLSGKNAGLGQAMLNAAQQAVFDAAGPNFELQPHDTATEGGAEGAARAAVSGGAQLIIGPLFAADIPAVMPVAENAGLQMLALSTDTSLAQRGVYVMGLAPGAQVERVVAYASAHGAHRFAALVPSTPYGALVGQTFQSAVSQTGGTVVDMETYDPVTSPGGADRAKILGTQRDHIDAVFLPEAGPDLKAVADQLIAAGFDATHVHVLGTGLWDVPGMGRLNPLLPGGWYAAPDPNARRNFVSSYASTFGQEPPRLTTLAYDATALAAVLAKRGARFDEAALTNPNGFAGLDGIFRLTSTGMVERVMAVNEITQDGAHVIDPSPSSFVGTR